MRLFRLFLPLALLLLLAPASTSSAAPRADNVNAEALDFTFSPDPITVPAGTTIVWTNVGRAPHTVTADDESFDSGRLNNGDTFSMTFTTPGSYGYYCVFHGTPG